MTIKELKEKVEATKALKNEESALIKEAEELGIDVSKLETKKKLQVKEVKKEVLKKDEETLKKEEGSLQSKNEFNANEISQKIGESFAKAIIDSKSTEQKDEEEKLPTIYG